jgi:Tfp pilus assembly protein FimT
VAGILLGIGVPSFQSFVANSRATTQANLLVAALNRSRSAAISRGTIVTLCPKSTATVTSTTCGNSGNWANGWHAFTDSGTSGVFDGTDVIIKHWEPLLGNPTVTTTGDNIQYQSNGTQTINEITLAMSQAGTTGDANRCVRIAPMGMVRVHVITETDTCP